MSSFSLTSVHYTPASAKSERTGLLGYLSLGVGDVLMINGVTLRRTRDGDLRLAYPERRNGGRRGHPYVRPFNDAARREIERQVFKRLGMTP